MGWSYPRVTSWLLLNFSMDMHGLAMARYM
jgi:hypothetical protein